MTDKIHILVIEDYEPGIAALKLKLSRSLGGGYEIHFAKTMSEAKDALDDHVFDCIVSDLNLPDSRCDDTIPTIRALAPQTPIIAISAFFGGREDGVSLAKYGVEDYFPTGQEAFAVAKDTNFFEGLITRIRHVVAKHQNVRKRCLRRGSFATGCLFKLGEIERFFQG